jgi:Tol biopolymer transport system component
LIVQGVRQHKLGAGLILLSGLLVLAAAAYGIYALLHHPPAVPFQTMNIRKLTDNGKASMAAISPDGKYVVHVVSDAGQHSLWIRHIATNSNTQIEPPAEAQYSGLSFSPDGNYIYFIRNEKERPGLGLLYQIPVLGGTPKLIVTEVDSRISFSPDGDRFTFLRVSGLGTSAVMVADADGSNQKKLVENSLPDEFSGHPAWSPDGKIITIMNAGRFEAIDAVTGRKTAITNVSKAGRIFASAWLPDNAGLLVAFSSPATNRATQIGYLAYPAGELRRVTSDLNEYDTALSATRDAKSLVTVATELSNNIWVMPASGRAEQAIQISSGKMEAVTLDWTSDGKILSSTFSDGFQFTLRGSNGAGKTTLLADPVPAFQASACGDGRYIVFSSSRSGKAFHIWRMDRSGGDFQQLTNGVQDSSPVCSPEGKWVVYRSLTDGQYTVWKVPIDGGTPIRLSSGNSFAPTVSPDGKLVAFRSNIPGLRSPKTPWAPGFLVVVSSDGGAPLHTLESDPRAGGAIRFTPDGQALSYSVIEHGISNLWAQPVSGGAPRQLTDFKTDLIFDYAWSRDGRQLALARGQVSRDVVLLTDTGK